LGDQPRGLKALGFTGASVEGLVDGTMPQRRVLMLAPGIDPLDMDVEREQVTRLFEDAMEY
jgi:hydroxyacid-oxoacid transhydrogenase